MPTAHLADPEPLEQRLTGQVGPAPRAGGRLGRSRSGGAARGTTHAMVSPDGGARVSGTDGARRARWALAKHGLQQTARLDGDDLAGHVVVPQALERRRRGRLDADGRAQWRGLGDLTLALVADRKSTRLNSS